MLPVSKIIVVDVQDSRLELARTLGATDVVNSRTEDARTRVTEITGGGPQYLVESSGVPTVLAHAIQGLAIGGTAAVVGVPPFGVTAPIDVADLVNGSKRVVGVVEGRSNPPVFLPRLASWWRRAGRRQAPRSSRYSSRHDRRARPEPARAHALLAATEEWMRSAQCPSATSTSARSAARWCSTTKRKSARNRA